MAKSSRSQAPDRVPVAAPALWSVSPQDVTWAQLALVPLASLLFAGLTTRTSHRLQLDR